MGTTKHCYIVNILGVSLMVSEKKSFCFSHYKSMGADDPGWVLGSSDPKGLISRIHVGNTKHCYILSI